MKKSTICISAFAACLVLAAAMTAPAEDAIKIVYNVGVAPLKFVDASSQPAGLFPDLWRFWAKKTDKPIQFVKAESFKDSLQMLKDGNVDLHAGLFKTPEREKFLDYSDSLLTLDYFIFTHPSVHPINSMKKTAGFLIGIPKGGYTERFVRSNVPSNRIVVYDRFQDLFRAALEGEIKVFIATELSLFYYLRENFFTNIFEYDPDHPLFSQVYYSAARKGRLKLIQSVDTGLKAITSEERKLLEDKWIVRDVERFDPVSISAPTDTQQDSVTAAAGDIRNSLNKEEQAFLKAHPVIRVHNEKSWPPFNYFEYSSPRGLSIDYMNLVAEKLGIKVEYVTGPSWSEFLEMIKRKELDVMLNIVKTEDRIKYLLYTEPYIRNPNVIVSSTKSPFKTLETLFGKTVAFPKGFFYEEVLTKSFPQIKRLPVEDTLASLKAVMFGRADAALGESAVIRTLINKNLLSGLRISGEVDIGNPDLTNLRIGVRNDWPLMRSLIMKAMAAVTLQEMNQIRQKWMVTEMESDAAQTTAPLSYGRLIAHSMAIFVMISLLAWILIKTIKKEHIAVSFGSRWFHGLVLVGLSIFVITACLLGWYTLEKNKEKILVGIGENLKETLKTADDRLTLWVAQKTAFIKLLGREPELVSLAKRLLAVAPSREELTASDALQDVRTFFDNKKQTLSNIDFAVINADHLNMASKDNADIGTRDPISLRNPGLLSRAFEGDVLFVPPMESDIPEEIAPKAIEAKIGVTKFFLGPIRDANEQIIAVMTLRVDPLKDFSRILPFSEARRTGETYAFNQNGRLLSESRFDEQLRRIGLIGEDQQSAWNVVIRDPGVNLVDGQRSRNLLSEQPFTQSVSKTLLLKRDMESANKNYGRSNIEVDTRGYRDYRGVPVLGAWLWNADLQLGLATEVDVAEALSYYYQIRRTVFGVLGFTLLLSVGAVLLVLILGERTSRALLRSQDELELRVQERTAELRKLSRATENSPASVVVTDKDGTIEYVNPTFSDVTGYSAEEAIGQNPRVLKSGNLPESHYKDLWNTILSGNVWRGEFLNKRKNGEVFWESASISPITDDTGEITHFVAVKQDTTERKAAEEALRVSEEKSRLLLESVGEGIFGVDLKGQLAFINPAANRMLGFTAEELIGCDVHGKIHHSRADGSSYPKEACPMYRTYADGAEHHIDDEVLWCKDGTSFPVEYTSMPIKKDDQVVGAVVTFKNITERKQMEREILLAKEKAEEATEAKSDFLANMSHEIRTPMNAVIGMAHLALKTELTTKQQDYLNKIQSSANSLLGIINDILDFSKIEAGKLDMESTDFILDDVLENLAALVTVKTREKSDLEVLFAVDQQVPRFLVGDPLRLGQILINLTNNAVKFTQSGEIVVSSELVRQDQDRVTLRFSVKDTGIGLSKSQTSKLFQAFTQADTSTTRKFGGTGLGLTISKRLVEMMDGQIRVESRAGVGSTFSFTAVFGLGREKVKARLAPSPDLRGLKVLVVDDNATSRNILQDILEAFSFEVILAASGEDGLEEIERADADQPFELVIMDWKMPGIDGFAASKRIKHHASLNHIPPIILVTAYAREDILRQVDEIGLEGYLLKPVSPSVLFDTVMEALGKDAQKGSHVNAKQARPSEDLEDIRGAAILLVEDNEINQQVASEILQDAGLHVDVANNGQEAVEAVKNDRYDAVLMDIQMPVMNGYTAAREIRKWEDELQDNMKNLPIIAMTAHAMAGDEKKSHDAGMNGHITKPIDPDQLFKTLQRWIPPEASRARQYAADTHAAAVPEATAAATLPESLPGFDLSAGLKRLRGNRPLYLKLLIRFGADYADTVNDLRSALAAGDLKAALSIVHNLKGLTGNLEATALQAAAVEMEAAVKKQTDGSKIEAALYRKLSDLEDAHRQAIGAVLSLGIPVEEKPETAEGGDIRLPPELARISAERIIRAAEVGDVSEVKSIAESLATESEAFSPLSNRLIQLADDFDLDGIVNFARKLEKQ